MSNKTDKTSKPSSGELTMEQLLAHAESMRGFKKFDHVKAEFITSDRRSAHFDVKGKAEAIVIEDHFKEAKDLIKTLKPGDVVDAVVMDPETRDGKILISLRHAAHSKLWGELSEAHKSGEPISVFVQSITDRGVAVNIGSLSAFVPVTQLTAEHAQNMDSLVGTHFKVQIIELDSSKNRVVLSEKSMFEASDAKKLKDLLEHVETGKVYHGVVTTVTSFGAFVEINIDSEHKVEGLVHVSEFSWGKTAHPSDMLTEGDDVEVVVISIEGGKLALSMKQAQTDPWELVSQRYPVDSKLKGRVVKQSDFGVFVELEPGVEGLIHMTKIPPATKFTKGQEVMVYVEECDPSARKIGLGVVLTTSKPIGYK